jgi:20S proteasome subunit alpha 6
MSSQAAKTYLEKHFESFPGCTVDDLVKHGLKALAASLSEGELTTLNCSLAIVSKAIPFTVLEDEAIEPYLVAMKEEELAAPEPMQDAGAVEAEPAAGAGDAAAAAGAGDAPAAGAGDADDAVPMET